MRISSADAKKELENTIRFGFRHKHYKRTIEVKKLAEKIMTGHNQDDLITQFRERETEEQKKQRVKLTKTLTRFVANQIVSYYRKVRRTDNVRNDIETTGTEKKLTPLRTITFVFGTPT